MRLVLVRHGHDLPSPGGENVLSRSGRQDLAETAHRIGQLEIYDFDVAFCSTSTRAVQSLEELDQRVPSKSIEPKLSLCNGEDSSHIDSIVADCVLAGYSRVLIVGHEPQLSNAVLRWCGFPENSAEPSDTPPWIISRGDGLVVTPNVLVTGIELELERIEFLNRIRRIPDASNLRSAGVF